MSNDITTRRTVTDALIARVESLEHLLTAQTAINDSQERVNQHTIEMVELMVRRLDALEEVMRLRFEFLERTKEFQ